MLTSTRSIRTIFNSWTENTTIKTCKCMVCDRRVSKKSYKCDGCRKHVCSECLEPSTALNTYCHEAAKDRLEVGCWTCNYRSNMNPAFAARRRALDEKARASCKATRIEMVKHRHGKVEVNGQLTTTDGFNGLRIDSCQEKQSVQHKRKREDSKSPVINEADSERLRKTKCIKHRKARPLFAVATDLDDPFVVKGSHELTMTRSLHSEEGVVALLPDAAKEIERLLNEVMIQPRKEAPPQSNVKAVARLFV